MIWMQEWGRDIAIVRVLGIAPNVGSRHFPLHMGVIIIRNLQWVRKYVLRNLDE